MKKEEEDKAAKKCMKEITKQVYAHGFYASIQEEDLIEAFKRGSNWRINSVWHDINSIPKQSKYIIIFNSYRAVEINHTGLFTDWEKYINDYRIVKWCYIEDLLPNK